MQYINFIDDAKGNTYFRRVIFTGKHCQLSVMALKPNEDVEWGIGSADKVIFIVSGEGIAEVSGEERPVRQGDAVFVTAGTEHDLVNSSEDEDLKLVMIYAPAVYPDGTLHSTKNKALVDPFSDLSGS